jgi:hypothetical protein
MLAPLAASLLRYGACLLPITLERCLFSKITTTMWSGGRTAFFEAPSVGRGVEGTMWSCCRTAVLGLLGAGRRTGPLGFWVASGATPLASFGLTGTTVGKLLADVGTADDD